MGQFRVVDWVGRGRNEITYSATAVQLLTYVMILKLLVLLV